MIQIHSNYIVFLITLSCLIHFCLLFWRHLGIQPEVDKLTDVFSRPNLPSLRRWFVSMASWFWKNFLFQSSPWKNALFPLPCRSHLLYFHYNGTNRSAAYSRNDRFHWFFHRHFLSLIISTNLAMVKFEKRRQQDFSSFWHRGASKSQRQKIPIHKERLSLFCFNVWSSDGWCRHILLFGRRVCYDGAQCCEVKGERERERERKKERKKERAHHNLICI